MEVRDGDSHRLKAVMIDDGERILDLIGIILVMFIIVSVGILILAAMNVPSQRSADEPEVDWALTRTNATHVQITHDSGEPVPASELIVTVNGFERRVTWSGLISQGDSGVVRGDRQQVVRLYWTGGLGDRSLLASWEI
jgi:hypothetical protein